MSHSLFKTLVILTVLAFAIVMIAGILSGHNIFTILKRGATAALVVGILWGLIGYLAFSENSDNEKNK